MFSLNKDTLPRKGKKGTTGVASQSFRVLLKLRQEASQPKELTTVSVVGRLHRECPTGTPHNKTCQDLRVADPLLPTGTRPMLLGTTHIYMTSTRNPENLVLYFMKNAHSHIHPCLPGSLSGYWCPKGLRTFCALGILRCMFCSTV